MHCQHVSLQVIPPVGGIPALGTREEFSAVTMGYLVLQVHHGRDDVLVRVHALDQRARLYLSEHVLERKRAFTET